MFFILNSHNSLKILVLYFLLCGCTEHQQIRLHCGIISTVLCVNSVIKLCHSSKHSAQQKASHTNKGSHKTPPKHLTVSIVRRHENPCSRSLFEPTEPTLQNHLHSSNLPNTLCSFCSLFQCLLQAEMHNISVMGKETQCFPPCHCLTKYRVHPWLSLSKSPVHYGNCSVVFGLVAASSELYSHTHFSGSLSALWLIT